MAWYEMNAGGIPASLKSDMNSVLNKKFGTVSQDYPPNGWPADVNLMGPLPEKTASGVIASFSDGADTVPVKSCTVAFGPGGGGGTPADPVALVGYSGVNVSKAGKNLLLPETSDLAPVTTNGIKRTYTLSTRTFELTGTNTKTDASWLIFSGASFVFNGLKSGVNYLFSHNLDADFYSQITYYDTNNTLKILAYVAGNSGRNASVSFTLPNDFDHLGRFQIGVRNTAGAVDIEATFQIEVGSAATAYEPYTTPETISDSFGQTVYGGERDLVNEIICLKQTYNYYNAGDVTGLYWNGRKTSQVDTYHRATFRIASSGLLKASTLGKCNRLSYSSNITGGTGSVEGFQVVPTAGLYFCIPLDLIGLSEATSATDDSVFLAAIRAYADNLQFSLELATPVDITGLTAHDIETNYADNNFYADIPDSTMTVEYRADIPLALNA